jgi:hypothetical protein
MCIKCAVKSVVNYVLTFHALALDRCVMRAAVNIFLSPFQTVHAYFTTHFIIHAPTSERCVMRAVVNVSSSLPDPSAAAAAKEEEAMRDDGAP